VVETTWQAARQLVCIDNNATTVYIHVHACAYHVCMCIYQTIEILINAHQQLSHVPAAWHYVRLLIPDSHKSNFIILPMTEWEFIDTDQQLWICNLMQDITLDYTWPTESKAGSCTLNQDLTQTEHICSLSRLHNKLHHWINLPSYVHSIRSL